MPAKKRPARKPIEKDIRKMEPKRLVAFALRVLRATPVARMKKRRWFRPKKSLRVKITKALRAMPDDFQERHACEIDLIFQHKKDCLVCAVGAVLLADGREAAAEWEGRQQGYKNFTYEFLDALSGAFEDRQETTVAAGRQAAIDFCSRVQKALTDETLTSRLPDSVRPLSWGDI
jgi:hypothetical protein